MRITRVEVDAAVFASLARFVALPFLLALRVRTAFPLFASLSSLLLFTGVELDVTGFAFATRAGLAGGGLLRVRFGVRSATTRVLVALGRVPVRVSLLRPLLRGELSEKRVAPHERGDEAPISMSDSTRGDEEGGIARRSDPFAALETARIERPRRVYFLRDGEPDGTGVPFGLRTAFDPKRRSLLRLAVVRHLQR